MYGRTYPSNVHSVYIMQRNAIRRVFNAHYNEHTNNYLVELSALRLFDLLKYKTGLSIYKANKNLILRIIRNLFVFRYGHVHTRQTGNFQQFDVRTTKKTNVSCHRWTKVVEFP